MRTEHTRRYHANWMTKQYRDRAARRLCVTCGNKLPPAIKTRRCLSCAETRSLWVKKHQNRLIRGRRCVNCGQPGATVKRKNCHKCLQTAREGRAVLRATRDKQGACVKCGKPRYKDLSRCQVCIKRMRDYQRLKMTGFSPEDYSRCYKAQKGRCAICNRRHALNRLHADHCHKKGTKRGLLCGGCNRGLGLFADSPQRLQQAAVYLRQF